MSANIATNLWEECVSSLLASEIALLGARIVFITLGVQSARGLASTGTISIRGNAFLIVAQSA